MSKSFAIIGLGRFGRSVAETLDSMGYEVLAIDIDQQCVQDVSHVLPHAVELHDG